MKSTRTTWLVALIVTVAMSLAGQASTAAASGTALCKVHVTACSVENLVTHIHGKTTSNPLFLTAVFNLKCESSLFDGWLSGPKEEPYSQIIHLEKLTWTGCVYQGLPCTLTTERLPYIELARTALNLANFTLLSDSIRIHCKNSMGGTFFNCLYSSGAEAAFEGALHTKGSGNGMVTFEEAPLQVTEGGLCPKFFADSLYELSEHAYVLSEATHPKPVPAAAGTALCSVHKEPCQGEARITGFAMEGATSLLTNLVDVSCEKSLIEAEALAPGEAPAPQQIAMEGLSWSECKSTGSATNNCEVTTETLPAVEVEKSSLNLGVASLSGAEVRFKCISGKFIKIDCLFLLEGGLSIEGALHQAGSGNGSWSAAELGAEPLEGFCPEVATWDASYEPSVEIYLTGAEEPEGTALCGVHEDPCEGNPVSNLELHSAEPLLIVTSDVTVGTIECQLSSLTASVGGLAPASEAQEINGEEFTFAGCRTVGSGPNNCTFTVEEIPSFDLVRTELNFGVANGLNGVVRVKCTIAGFIKMDCKYSWKIEFQAEGAFRSAGAGYGGLSAFEVPLKEAPGAFLCPKESTLYGAYESLEPLFVMS